MTVTLKNIVDSQEAMQKLSGKSLRGRTAFKVARLLKKLESEVSIFMETRTKLINKYAKRQENGEFMFNDKYEYQFDPEEANKFVAEINKLLAEEIQIDAAPIMLEEIEELDFTPAEMAMLEPFIEE